MSSVICAARHPTDNTVILIVRGEKGYHPWKVMDVDNFNARCGVSPTQAEAMLVGSMFGWNCPGAQLAFTIDPRAE
jgi:hypothetical protein